MSKTTVSSRAFNQNASGAKRAASKGPVIITDRGRPAHVLLTIEAYNKPSRKTTSIVDRLAMPNAADVAFEAPRLALGIRPANLR